MINASDHGFKAWAFDPAIESATGAALVDGDIHLVGLRLGFPANISTIHGYITTAGATIANCFAGLYDEDGDQLGVTADQATPWTSTGLVSMALTSAVDVSPGWLYVALLMGSGTTDVQFAKGNHAAAALSNANMSAPKLRCAVVAGSATSLPSTIDTSALAAGSEVHWVALS